MVQTRRGYIWNIHVTWKSIKSSEIRKTDTKDSGCSIDIPLLALEVVWEVINADKPMLSLYLAGTCYTLTGIELTRRKLWLEVGEFKVFPVIDVWLWVWSSWNWSEKSWQYLLKLEFSWSVISTKLSTKGRVVERITLEVVISIRNQ